MHKKESREISNRKYLSKTLTSQKGHNFKSTYVTITYIIKSFSFNFWRLWMWIEDYYLHLRICAWLMCTEQVLLQLLQSFVKVKVKGKNICLDKTIVKVWLSISFLSACVFGGMMVLAYSHVHVYIIACKKLFHLCKIWWALYGARSIYKNVYIIMDCT